MHRRHAPEQSGERESDRNDAKAAGDLHRFRAGYALKKELNRWASLSHFKNELPSAAIICSAGNGRAKNRP